MELKVFLAAVLLAFGIAVPLPAFAAGAFICAAGAYAAMIFLPPETKVSLWKTLVAAGVIGLLFAMAHGAFTFVRVVPLQLGMGVAGVLSRCLILAFAAYGEGLSDRARQAAASLKIPGEK